MNESTSWVCLLVLFGLLEGCQQKQNQSMDTKDLSIDSVSISLNEAENKAPKESNTVRLIDSLLMNPIDLPAYKKKKRSANSGIAQAQVYFHKPQVDGAYYRYFWFHELRRKYGEQLAFDAVKIVVYKHGEIDQYLDENEELISLTAKVKDPDLGFLDLVDKNKTALHDLYGKPDLIKSNNWIYKKANNVLVLTLSNEKVEWIRFSRLKPELSLQDLPDDLFKYPAF